MRKPRRLGNVLVDVLDHMRLLQRGAGNRRVQATEVAQRLADGIQARAREPSLFNGQLRRLAAVTDDLHRRLGMILQAFDHRLDFRCRLLRTLRKQTHFIRHHGESTTLFAGPCRFDRCVEGKQVGLLGNRANHLQHAADLGTFGGQGANHLDRLVNGARELVDLLQAAVDIDLALLRLRLGITHFGGRMLGVFRHVLHAVSHLVDRGGHQLHLLRLLLATLLGLRGIVAQFAGRLTERTGRHLQLTDHPAQFGGKRIEVVSQFGHFVLAVGIEAAGQVTFAAGDVGHGVHGFLQGTHDAARDQDHQQSHDHGNRQPDNGGLDHLALEFALHVVDVNPGTKYPAPRFE